MFTSPEIDVPPLFNPKPQQKKTKKLTYFDQAIPAPDGMFEFERIKAFDYDKQNKVIKAFMLGEPYEDIWKKIEDI